MPQLPRLVSSQTVYDGHLLTVELDELEMDGGVITKREIIRHPGAVCMVPVTESGQLLFVTQYRHAAGGRLLELPAGTLEAGEAPAGRRLSRAPGRGRPETGPGRASGRFLCRAQATRPSTSTSSSAIALEPSSLDGDEDEDIEIERAEPGRGAGRHRLGRDLRREVRYRHPPMASIVESIGRGTFYSTNVCHVIDRLNGTRVGSAGAGQSRLAVCAHGTPSRRSSCTGRLSMSPRS